MLEGPDAAPAELFAWSSEINALKAQLAAIVSVPRPPTPIRSPFAIA